MADPFITEGFGPLPLGCNGATSPLLLNEGQYWRGVNLSLRGGFAKTRPGLVKVWDSSDPDNFPAPTLPGTPLVFQGAARYRLNEGDRLIFVVNGSIYQIKLFDDASKAHKYTVANTARGNKDQNGDEIDVRTEVFSSDFGKDASGNWSQLVNLSKIERFFVVQDGYHQGAIIGENDNPNAARVSFQSDAVYVPPPSGESTSVKYSDVPIATAMGFAAGRMIISPHWLWKALEGVYKGPSPVPGADDEDGRANLMASDLDTDPGSCLRFIETNLAIGGAWRMPVEIGKVLGLATFKHASSVDGNGALLAFCQDGVSAFNLSYEAGAWGSHKQSVAQMLYSGIGFYSPRSIVTINDDIWFRRIDGLGAIKHTMSQFSTGLSCTPLSFEISHRLELDTLADLPTVSASFSDNLLLLTSGSRFSADPFAGFRGLLPLDMAPMYSLGTKTSPAYVDLWTGLEFLQVVAGRYNGRERQFVFAKYGGHLSLWYFDDAVKLDKGTQPIKCRVYTPQYMFKDAFRYKRFEKAELSIRDLVGQAKIRVYWRTEGSFLWVLTRELTVWADETGAPQTRARLTFPPTEENPCDSLGQPLRTGLGFQFCVEWEGSLTIERGVFFATPERAFEPANACKPEVKRKLIASGSAIPLDDFDYGVL